MKESSVEKQNNTLSQWENSTFYVLILLSQIISENHAKNKKMMFNKDTKQKE